ncbi:MAG TPA: RNase adapter RapZ [Actinocrinis sp.]|jgi:UPF0042 nucleotide-binding protein
MSIWLGYGALQCLITTYGVLHGPAPEGGVLTLDLRTALRNPHHDPAMRELTGLDPAVRDHVLATPGAERLINDAVFRVIAVLEGYAQSRGLRADLHVYCQGGRHRSVAAAEEIARRLRALGVNVEVEHRDIAKSVVQAKGASKS